MSTTYDLELERVIAGIRQKEAKRVCIQLADGLKPEAKLIQDTLEKELPDCVFFIYGGSCFGACDTPPGLERLRIDMLVSFGHARWNWGEELVKFGPPERDAQGNLL
jgi:diphthamide biosynthesis enzyme Dph1/Dph2-like protein